MLHTLYSGNSSANNWDSLVGSQLPGELSQDDIRVSHDALWLLSCILTCHIDHCAPTTHGKAPRECHEYIFLLFFLACA